jgi:hypothetical protein
MSYVAAPTVSATYHWVDKLKKRAMKKHLQLAVSLSALVAYAVIVCVGYFHARAEIVVEACGVDCLVQRVDALTKKDWSIGVYSPYSSSVELDVPFVAKWNVGNVKLKNRSERNLFAEASETTCWLKKIHSVKRRNGLSLRR